MKGYLRNVIAVDLILAGIVLLISQLLPQVDIWYTIWPLLLLVPGLLLLGEYILTGKKHLWFLAIGWLLILLSMLNIFEIYTSNTYNSQSMFLFPLIILVSFLPMKRKYWFKSWVWFWSVVTVVLLLVGFNLSDYVLAIALITVGVLVIKRREKLSADFPDESEGEEAEEKRDD